MQNVTLTLQTGTHCIETEAKHELRRLTDMLLETEDESAARESGEQLELLTEFLERSDFNALRSSDERLAGIRPGLCVIGRDSMGKPVVKELYDSD